MHNALIDKLIQFARKYKLLFEYNFDEESKIYYFSFRDRELTWNYRRAISAEELDLINGSSACVVYNIIGTMKKFISRQRRNYYCFDPSYTIDKDGNMRIIEVSLIRKPTE